MARCVRRWTFGIALAAAASLVVPAAPAVARTSAKAKGDVVTIKVPIDLIGGKGRKGPDGTPLDEYWEKAINDTWGNAFARMPYKNCTKFRLKVKVKPRRWGASPRDGWHAVYVPPGKTSGLEDAGWEGVPGETSRNPKTGDGTRSYEHGRDGEVSVDAPPVVVAHEFGHLLGLGDDRVNGKAKPGREGTLMVGGAEGSGSRIDQNLIDRIGDVIRKHLQNQGKKLPKCETWDGSIEGKESHAGFLRDEPIEGKIAVTVASSGDVTGTAQFVYHDLQGDVPFTSTVTGRKSDKGFTLDFDTEFPESISAGFVSTHKAEGTYVVGPYPEAHNFMVELRVTLTCNTKCQREAVG